MLSPQFTYQLLSEQRTITAITSQITRSINNTVQPIDLRLFPDFGICLLVLAVFDGA